VPAGRARQWAMPSAGGGGQQRVPFSSGGPRALAVVTFATLTGIYFVHWGQQLERQNLKQGVVRDEILYAKKLKEHQERLNHHHQQ